MRVPVQAFDDGVDRMSTPTLLDEATPDGLELARWCDSHLILDYGSLLILNRAEEILWRQWSLGVCRGGHRC